MKKNIIRIICFILVLMVVLILANKVFRFKYSDGIYTAEKFYELENNSVDVLFLGSSHAYENFNTGTLWDEQGIASFIFAGSVQPMWNSYYFLKEALKTQTPKLIVLEGFRLVMKDEFSEDSRIIFNNFGLRWSLDKVDSIKASAPRERWTEFFLEYIQYHNRYSELSAEDFLPNKGNHQYDDWKGFGCNMDTVEFKAKDLSDVTEKDELYEKTEKYYRATIELAQEHNIPILVVVCPYAGIKKAEQRLYNTAKDIATEYGVPFINCNLLIDEIGIDYQYDAGDSSHLNYRGNQKLSTFIGNYLVNNYNIPDHRGDENYASWQRSADYVRQMIYDQELVDEYSLNKITEKLQNPNYSIIVSIDGTCSTMDENLSLFFQTIGFSEIDYKGIWYKNSDGVIWISGNNESIKNIMTPYHDICLKRILLNETNYSNSIIIDNEICNRVSNGVNVVVYDTKIDKVADVFGVDIDNEYAIIR